MNVAEKKINEITYRKVYLSDLKAILDIYQDTKTAIKPEQHPKVPEQLTAQFGLPLAIAEHSNKLIGYATAKLNELEEVEIISYYKDGINQPDTQPPLEGLAIDVVNSTFGTGYDGGNKLKYAAEKLIKWLNNCA